MKQLFPACNVWINDRGYDVGRKWLYITDGRDPLGAPKRTKKKVLLTPRIRAKLRLLYAGYDGADLTAKIIRLVESESLLLEP